MNKSFDKYLIEKNNSLKDALKLLDKLPNKILFIIDNDKKLLGSLTDGDIRRWILRNGKLNTNVYEVCHKKCLYEYDNYDVNHLKKIMISNKIYQIPIVDKNLKVVNIVFYEDLFGENFTKKIDKLNVDILIMAGGKGQRLEPFTKIVPKPLIPIGDKPIIEHIIDKFVFYGIKLFFISINYKSELIKAYFKEISPNYQIKFVKENKPLGTIGALQIIENEITYDDVLLVNCDILININYNDLYKYHKDNNNDITIISSLKIYKIPYGICKVNNGNLIEIVEKPEYEFLVNTGMYLIKKELIKLIPKDTFYNATDFINDAKQKGFKIGVFPINDNDWVDIGEWDEYKKSLNKISFLME